MITTMLFDIYGLIIPREMRFSKRFSDEFKVPMEKLLPFFQNEFQLCLVGKADLKKELIKYINTWGWQGSIDDLLKYWIEYDNSINKEIIDSVEELRDNGIKCFLNTQNEKYAVAYAFEKLNLKKHFDGAFSSDKIGHIKSQPEYWQAVYEKLGSPDKKSVLCWDDDEKNIKTAIEFGFNAELYTDLDTYKNKINSLLSNS